jgi:hypothetical protein
MSDRKPPIQLEWISCPVCGKRLLKAVLVKGTMIEPYCKACRAPRLIVA